MRQSFKGSMCRTLGGTNTSLSVAGGFIRKGEFAQITSDHIEFDFDVVERFSIIDGDKVSNHFWHDDGVSKMCFNWGGFLTKLSVLLCLFAFHIQSVVFMLDF